MRVQKNDFGQEIGPDVVDWREPKYPSRENMEGQFCRLEALNPEIHGPALYDAFMEDREGRSWTYLPYGPFLSFEAFSEWLTNINIHTTHEQPDPIFFCIVLRSSNQPVGLISYLNIRACVGSVEVGHVHYANPLKQNPAATEAQFLLMQRVFEQGYRRYEWKCDALNRASYRAAERLGFSFEGIFRNDRVYKGRSRDTAWFSIIDTEWPLLQKVFKQWLSPENFDEHVKQKRALADFRGDL